MQRNVYIDTMKHDNATQHHTLQLKKMELRQQYKDTESISLRTQ